MPAAGVRSRFRNWWPDGDWARGLPRPGRRRRRGPDAGDGEIFAMKLLLFVSLLVCLGAAGCRGMPEPLRLEPVAERETVARAAEHGLVPVSKYDSTIRQDLRYATARNVFGKVLYPGGFPALLAEPTARRLAAASRELRRHGLVLLVLDAYRPPEVQWQLYQMFRDDRYVADPRRKWSKHCYGRAVDVTLTDLAGNVLEMPSAFDDFSKMASARYAGNNAAVRRRLERLQRAMTGAGFSVYEDEWWHFNDLSDPAVLAGPPVFGRGIGLPAGR